LSDAFSLNAPCNYHASLVLLLLPGETVLSQLGPYHLLLLLLRLWSPLLLVLADPPTQHTHTLTGKNSNHAAAASGRR